MATVRIRKVVDRSGSMRGREEGVVAGLNEFNQKLKQTPTDDTVLVSFGVFDKNGSDPILNWIYEDKPLDEVPDVTPDQIAPRGRTPLNDAIAEAVFRTDGQLEGDDRALVVVMTDGFENASEEYKENSKLKSLVAEKEQGPFEFIFLGANIDSFTESRSRGINSFANWSGSSAGVRNASRRAGTLGSSYLQGNASYLAASAASMDFADIPDDDSQSLAQEEAIARAAATVTGS